MLFLWFILAARPSDEVARLPGFAGPMPSKVYSGYIKASAAGQTFLSHYVFTESQRDPAGDPLVLWQQGGPGSSGFGYGYLAELGPYRLDADSIRNGSTIPVPERNPHSWDRISNLLLFEHPPGTGFSYCVDANEGPTPCEWSDQTQAEAFYATLAAWYDVYHEYQSHELRIIGESYAGLLIPFLTHEIFSRHPTGVPARQLKGIAIGNGCPGTSGSTPAKPGTCNGPYGNYDTQHVLELAHGHGALPRAQWDALVRACAFPCAAPSWSEACDSFSPACEALISAAHEAIGDFNIYNFYDNCGDGNQADASRLDRVRSGRRYRETLNAPSAPRHTGGQSYGCGTGKAATAWANEPSVRAALHMKPETFYGYPWALYAGAAMKYHHYTGSSYDLYPGLLHHTPVLIYNGDVDACVPYNSNADWIAALAAEQAWEQAEAWRPWLLSNVPAGYVTRYRTRLAHNLTFITVKESGHMVPQYQPARAFAFFSRWLEGTPFA